MTSSPVSPSDSAVAPPGRTWLAYVQLVRLPLVFTAVADVVMGMVVVQGGLTPGGTAALVIAASCQLYLAGMVLNDVFDALADARLRPERPIPSGRVDSKAAACLGWSLLVGGAAFGWLATYFAGDWRPGLVATLLAVCIVLYDAILKRTSLAPPAMGTCRTLNVLLGMSIVAGQPGVAQQPLLWNPSPWVVALGIGVYITGVTWLARSEAGRSSRIQLTGATVVLCGGLALLASIPRWVTDPATLYVAADRWYFLWIVLALVIVRRCAVAIIRPDSARVQAAVRHCLASLVVLDAAVALTYGGAFWGCALLLLLAPLLLLRRWIEVT